MSASVFSLITAQCETHARRMLWAKHALQAVLPLNADRLHGLDDAQVAIVDQFVGRFAKLQDAMGAKLLLMILEGTSKNYPFMLRQAQHERVTC